MQLKVDSGAVLDVVQGPVTRDDRHAGAGAGEEGYDLRSVARVVDDHDKPLAVGPRPVLLAASLEGVRQHVGGDAQRDEQLAEHVGDDDRPVPPVLVEIHVQNAVRVPVPQRTGDPEGQFGLARSAGAAQREAQGPGAGVPLGDGGEGPVLLVLPIDEVHDLRRQFVRHAVCGPLS